MTHLAENFRIAENDDTILCTSESNIETPWVIQKANTLMLVASDAAEDDVILLPSLESIHTGNFDLFVEVLLQRAIELHVVDNV